MSRTSTATFERLQDQVPAAGATEGWGFGVGVSSAAPMPLISGLRSVTNQMPCARAQLVHRPLVKSNHAHFSRPRAILLPGGRGAGALQGHQAACAADWPLPLAASPARQPAVLPAGAHPQGGAHLPAQVGCSLHRLAWQRTISRPHPLRRRVAFAMAPSVAHSYSTSAHPHSHSLCLPLEATLRASSSTSTCWCTWSRLDAAPCCAACGSLGPPTGGVPLKQVGLESRCCAGL